MMAFDNQPTKTQTRMADRTPWPSEVVLKGKVQLIRILELGRWYHQPVTHTKLKGKLHPGRGSDVTV